MLLAMRSFFIAVLGLVTFMLRGEDVPAPSLSEDTPIHIPLSVTRLTSYGTYKPTITIGIGNLKPLPFGFDTGSSGLRVFADANLEAAGSGVQLTQTPTSVTYKNPGRITYHGVIAYARLRFGSFSTPKLVPIAYLTSAARPKTNPNGKLPDLRDHAAMGSYGVFGAGLTGRMFAEGHVPNPILTPPCAKSNCYPGGGFVVPKGVLPSGLCFG
jgi:hypothetical protein